MTDLPETTDSGLPDFISGIGRCDAHIRVPTPLQVDTTARAERWECKMADIPTTPTALLELMFDYLLRAPASVGNVISHFCLTRQDAQMALRTLERHGRARMGRNFMWEACND
jgi:hypothetical protein